VQPSQTEDPERALILTYAPMTARPALAALLALDDALALLLRTTREPALGQMRLAWWREALERLDTAPPPAEPVLQGIADAVLCHDVMGAELVPIVHGWEVLIEEERLDAEALGRFAAGRGALFIIAGRLLGAVSDPVEGAGRGWALADLAANLQDGEDAVTARAIAEPLLREATRVRWSRNGRALGAMAHLALRDLGQAGRPPVGAPSRVARLLWHRLTGR
jgi:15-cis-phytoene synthase